MISFRQKDAISRIPLVMIGAQTANPLLACLTIKEQPGKHRTHLVNSRDDRGTLDNMHFSAHQAGKYGVSLLSPTSDTCRREVSLSAIVGPKMGTVLIWQVIQVIR